MPKEMRWRVVSLQAVLVVVLGGAAMFAISEGNFVNGMIHDQLAAQEITFPDRSAAVTGGALDPAQYPDLQQYAGQHVDNGAKAYAYATYFIGHHLKSVFVNPDTGKAMTYAAAGTYISTHSKGADAATIAKWNAQRTTLFQGEMLRTSLLNAWGWSMVGTYTTYAGYALLLAALVVLGALVFELLFANRPDRVTVPQSKATRTATPA